MLPLHNSCLSLIFTRTRKLILLQEKSITNPGKWHFLAGWSEKPQHKHPASWQGSSQMATELSAQVALPKWQLLDIFQRPKAKGGTCQNLHNGNTCNHKIMLDIIPLQPETLSLCSGYSDKRKTEALREFYSVWVVVVLNKHGRWFSSCLLHWKWILWANYAYEGYRFQRQFSI